MRRISRRAFTGGLAVAAAGVRFAWADQFPKDLKITRIVSFDLRTRRKKYVGKNSRRGDHGQGSRDRMARLYTNVGVEGVGRCWKPKEALAPLLGTNPFKDFDLASRKTPGPLGSRTMVLWDLAGKLLKQPVYRPFVKAKALDVLQGDMNSFGIEGILAEAAMARPRGILVAPHNWSSLLSLYLQVHVGLVVPNFYRAEHDPLASSMLIAEGHRIEGGVCSVPEAPGFGVAIDEKRFANVRPLFDLKA